MNNMSEADMSFTELSECDIDKENTIEMHSNVLKSKNDEDFELHKKLENNCDQICDKSSFNDLTGECSQFDKIDTNFKNHDENRNTEILREFVEDVVEYDDNEISKSDGYENEVKLKTPEQQSDVIKSGGRCCKILLILSSTTIWLSFLVYCYLYLTTVCVPVELWCPTPTQTFSAQACCSSLWLNLGSTVGLGNECTIDMADMESGCPMYDCYKNQSTTDLNVNGCSYVPNTLFNEAACNIHDLCYITPGSTKKACDDTFVENIILIYCDNVNVFERIACRGRAQLAGAVVSAIDSFYNDSEDLRSACNLESNSFAIFTGILATLFLTLTSACFIHLIVKRLRAKKIESEEDELDDAFEYQLGKISETNEPMCYCDEPIENCNICDEVFVQELSLECDINNIEAQETNTKQDSKGHNFDQKTDLDIIEKEVDDAEEIQSQNKENN